MDVALTPSQIKHYRAVAELLSQAYRNAAKGRAWVEVVPVAEASKWHALGSKEQWVNGFDLSMVMRGVPTYHPNLDGHRAVAEMLYRRIKEDGGSVG